MNALVLSPPVPKSEKSQAQWVRLTLDEFSELYIREHREELTVEAPVLCTCLQRDYPHELSVHAQIGREILFNSRLRFSWPWSLRLLERGESAERKEA